MASRSALAQSVASACVAAMSSSNLTFEPWESTEKPVRSQKARLLEHQNEVVVYSLPLPKIAKTNIIDVLRQFQADFGCKLSLRGRKEDEAKRLKLQEAGGAEVEKLHQVTLKLVGNQKSQEQRLVALSQAETYVDAFLRNVLKSPGDCIYMFPAADAPDTAARTERPKRFRFSKTHRDHCFFELLDFI